MCVGIQMNMHGIAKPIIKFLAKHLSPVYVEYVELTFHMKNIRLDNKLVRFSLV